MQAACKAANLTAQIDIYPQIRANASFLNDDYPLMLGTTVFFPDRLADIVGLPLLSVRTVFF